MIEDHAVAGYAIEPDDFQVLLTIAECLRSPDYLSPHACRNLADMITLVLGRAIALLADDTSPVQVH
jgi:hypothetical protein